MIWGLGVLLRSNLPIKIANGPDAHIISIRLGCCGWLQSMNGSNVDDRYIILTINSAINRSVVSSKSSFLSTTKTKNYVFWLYSYKIKINKRIYKNGAIIKTRCLPQYELIYEQNKRYTISASLPSFSACAALSGFIKLKKKREKFLAALKRMCWLWEHWDIKSSVFN